MLIVPSLRGLRQDGKFKASLGYKNLSQNQKPNQQQKTSGTFEDILNIYHTLDINLILNMYHILNIYIYLILNIITC